ncbi:carboxypeptidase-like regulatory domain-containing protein [Paraflavitalea speifideaquila]|uniref:carboxypeptidase-like regulatory domain-containing protein n=1 Tax=Paraflavitalea speifideaquila TaxID=3076558 RepID=UPI0028E77EE3|nr:carboxypeptidase-like regulatory domain-containing protein [Paraflavitalea speifideiaquila]
MFLKYLTTFILAFLLLQPVWSQSASRTITGTVTSDEDTNPLEGVLVSVKGSNMVSGSQADGVYYIPVTTKDSVLVFSHSEFQTREVKLTGASEYNIVLHKKRNRPLAVYPSVPFLTACANQEQLHLFILNSL